MEVESRSAVLFSLDTFNLNTRQKFILSEKKKLS